MPGGMKLAELQARNTDPAYMLEQALQLDASVVLKKVDKVLAERHLLDYIDLMWPVLEPGRPFVRGWTVEAICDHLEAVSSKQLRRLLINVPPGCMKSLTTDVLWPSWEWGPRNQPHLRYVTASYSEALTVRDNRRTRALIQSPIYQALWGDRFKLTSDQNAKVRFDTDRTGFKIATSVGGLGTGERGDRFNIDDPHNVKQAESEAIREGTLMWFSEVVPTRLNDEDSAIIVIMQRVHSRDVSGHILASELGYEHLCLPMEHERRLYSYTSVPRQDAEPVEVARVPVSGYPYPCWMTRDELREEQESLEQEGRSLPDGFVPHWQMLTPQDRRSEEGELLWEERFSRAAVDEVKKALSSWGGSYAVAGQLQQRPSPRGGGLFRREWFQILEREPTGGRVVRGWDLAGTEEASGKQPAYTAGVRMRRHEGRFIISHVVRDRLEPGGVEALMRAVAEQDGLGVFVDYPQDPGQAGKAQVRALGRLLAGFNFGSSPESGDKVTRASPLAAQAEAGNLYLVRGPWNDAFIDEACAFPRGDFLDQVDAASRAFARLLVDVEEVLGAAPERISG